MAVDLFQRSLRSDSLENTADWSFASSETKFGATTSKSASGWLPRILLPGEKINPRERWQGETDDHIGLQRTPVRG